MQNQTPHKKTTTTNACRISGRGACAAECRSEFRLQSDVWRLSFLSAKYSTCVSCRFLVWCLVLHQALHGLHSWQESLSRLCSRSLRLAHRGSVAEPIDPRGDELRYNRLRSCTLYPQSPDCRQRSTQVTYTKKLDMYKPGLV